MKKIGIVLLVIVMSTAVAFAAGVNGTFAGYNVVNVQLNGTALKSDVPGVVLENRTVLPLRAVAENMNAIVDWDQATMTANLVKPEINIVLAENITEYENGTYDIVNAGCSIDTLGVDKYICGYFDVGPMEEGTMNYRVVVKAPDGSVFDTSAIDALNCSPNGSRGYFLLEDLSFQKSGNYSVQFQLEYEGTYSTVGTTTLTVQ